MKQREKLIELIGNSLCCPKETDCAGCEYKKYELCTETMVADYLISNGVVVLPCKVGDTVYKISNRMCKEKIRRGNTCYECDGTESWNNCFRESDTPFAVEFEYDMIDEIDKTIFLTKEEAEKAFAKRKGGDEC